MRTLPEVSSIGDPAVPMAWLSGAPIVAEYVSAPTASGSATSLARTVIDGEPPTATSVPVTRSTRRRAPAVPSTVTVHTLDLPLVQVLAIEVSDVVRTT